MRKIIFAGLAASALALTLAPAAQAGILAPAARGAASTWTVTPGGAFFAQGARFADFGTLVCDAPGFRNMKGKLKSGSGLPPTIGTIRVAEKHPLGCDVANGKPRLALTFTGLPWGIIAQKYDAKDSFVHGEVFGISATIAATTGNPACTAVIGGPKGKTVGREEFRYHNGGVLRFLSGDLRFEDVTGCTGVLKNGQKASFTARFGPLTAKGTTTAEVITSP